LNDGIDVIIMQAIAAAFNKITIHERTRIFLDDDLKPKVPEHASENTTNGTEIVHPYFSRTCVKKNMQFNVIAVIVAIRAKNKKYFLY